VINGIPAQSTDLSIGKDKHVKSDFSLSDKNQLDDPKSVKIILSSKAGSVIAGEGFNELSGTAGSIINLLLKDGAGLMKIIAPFFSESGDIFPFEKSGQGVSVSLNTLYSKDNILHLRDLILSFSLKSGKADKEFLPRLFNKSGLLFEKKLSDFLSRKIFDTGKNDFKKMLSHDIKNVTALEFKKIADQDLKASILKLMSGSEVKADNFLNSLGDFSETIEKFQVFNFHSSQSGRYLIPFPVFFNGSLNFGQLFFNLDNSDKRKKKKKRRIVKVSLLLTMSELGPLRVDMALLEREISGIIQVADEETCIFVREMIPELKIGLNKHDFHVLSMDCEVAAQEKINNAVFLHDILQDEDQGLNIVI